MLPTKSVDIDSLRNSLLYDPDTGVFTWKIRSANRIHIGDTAGSVAGKYLAIKLNGSQHLAHRLAWAYVHGDLPMLDIDHINGNRFDNRIINLRPVDRQTNCQNRTRARSDSFTGLLGVCSEMSGKFSARIRGNDRQDIRIGLYETPEEAHAAYMSVKKQYQRGAVA